MTDQKGSRRAMPSGERRSPRVAMRSTRLDRASAGGVVLAGEGVEVGEGEAAPGGAQQGEPGGAVAGVEEGAGEGEEVEDLLALGEGFDFYGAVGDGVGEGLEGLDDVEEMGAVADEDGEGGLRIGGAPVFGDGADLGGVFAGFVDAEGGAVFGLGVELGGLGRASCGQGWGLWGWTHPSQKARWMV